MLYEDGVQRIIELLPDNDIKFYCKFIEDESYKNCLVTELINSFQRCYYCKAPYYRDFCHNLKADYDRRYLNLLKNVLVKIAQK